MILGKILSLYLLLDACVQGGVAPCWLLPTVMGTGSNRGAWSHPSSLDEVSLRPAPQVCPAPVPAQTGSVLHLVSTWGCSYNSYNTNSLLFQCIVCRVLYLYTRISLEILLCVWLSLIVIELGLHCLLFCCYCVRHNLDVNPLKRFL